MTLLEAYLPTRLSSEQVQSEIQAIVSELAVQLGRKPAPSDMGKVMGLAKMRLAGKAEMAQVSTAVKAALAA